MEFVDVLFGRRAVRDFTDEPVSRGTIETLLRAAVQAPSAMNCQPWAFVVIQDKQLLKSYSDRAKPLCAEAFKAEGSGKALDDILLDPSFNIFYNCETLIVIWAQPTGQHPDWDCCLAAQNLMLAAYDMGLGTCPIGLAWPLFEQADVKKKLNVPSEYRPVMPIIVGYPRGKPAVVERQRADIRLWKNTLETIRHDTGG